MGIPYIMTELLCVSVYFCIIYMYMYIIQKYTDLYYSPYLAVLLYTHVRVHVMKSYVFVCTGKTCCIVTKNKQQQVLLVHTRLYHMHSHMSIMI